MTANTDTNDIKFDLHNNDPDDIADMKLAPASDKVTTLTLTDSTNRTIAWDKNKDKLTVKNYTWHKNNTPITADSICQLSVITTKIEAKYTDKARTQHTIPEEHIFFRRATGEGYADKCLSTDISKSKDSGNKSLHKERHIRQGRQGPQKGLQI